MNFAIASSRLAPDMLEPGRYVVGQPVSRLEDPVLLRGEGRLSPVHPRSRSYPSSRWKSGAAVIALGYAPTDPGICDASLLLRPIGSRFFKREPDFQRHLIVVHLPVFDVPPCLDHLEPSKVLQGLRRTCDGSLDCVFNARLRGAYNLDDLVDMVLFFHFVLCLFGGNAVAR